MSELVARQRLAMMELALKPVRHSSVTFMEKTAAPKVTASTTWFLTCGTANMAMEGGVLALKKAPT